MVDWKPAADLTGSDVVWAYIASRAEVWPVKLATAVGMRDSRSAIAPRARFMIHAKTGQGVFVEWWCTRDVPAEKSGTTEEVKP